MARRGPGLGRGGRAAVGVAVVGLAVWWLWPTAPTPPAPPEARAAPPPPTRTWRAPTNAGSPDPSPEEATAASIRTQLEALGYPAKPPADDGWFVTIEVEVVWPDGDPAVGAMVYSPDCSVYPQAIDADGAPARLVVSSESGSCEVQARVQDGYLFRRTERVVVAFDDHEPYQVELVMPEERTGGLGVTILEDPAGIRVGMVHPGTPAWRMGLEPGDLIVEVDGTPTTALAAQDFIEIMTGPEGTDVDFVLAYNADTGWVEEDLSLTRQVLDPQEIAAAAAAIERGDTGDPAHPGAAGAELEVEDTGLPADGHDDPTWDDGWDHDTGPLPADTGY